MIIIIQRKIRRKKVMNGENKMQQPINNGHTNIILQNEKGTTYGI